MSNFIRNLSAALAGVASLAMVSGAGSAAEDAGHSKDYRTFLQGGEIRYGEIGDSYTADLVM